MYQNLTYLGCPSCDIADSAVSGALMGLSSLIAIDLSSVENLSFDLIVRLFGQEIVRVPEDEKQDSALFAPPASCLAQASPFDETACTCSEKTALFELVQGRSWRRLRRMRLGMQLCVRQYQSFGSLCRRLKQLSPNPLHIGWGPLDDE